MKRLALVPVAMLTILGGCQQSDAGSSQTPAEQAAPTPDKGEPDDAAPAPAVDLAGEWRVAGIDGAPIDESYAIALSADGEMIWWDPACAMQYREYSIAGHRFAAPARNNNDLEVCEIGYPPELDQLWSALEAADHIERTPENAVLISGNGRSVTLFSQ